MRTSYSITLAAIAAIAACNGDAGMTAPPQQPTPPAALQPTIRLIVLDSTRLAFAGTAADRAAGHYVFQILGAVPAIGPGDYVAGKQGGLFLGRVLSVARSADRLTLELAPAAWNEVLKPFAIHIPFTRGAGSGPSPYGVVRWGPWRLANRPGQRPQAAPPFHTARGAAVDPFDFDPQDFFLSDFDLCVSGGIVKICNISAKLVSAHFSLTGGVDVGANLDILGLSADAHATFNEQLNTDIDFQFGTFGATGQLGVEVPVGPGFVREFTVGPFSGEVTVGLILGAEGTFNGTIEPHVAVSDTVTIGGSISTSSGFDSQFDAAGHFDAGAKVVDLGDVGAKVSLGPKAEVKLSIADGVFGFALGAGADGFVEGTENLQGILGNENWHVHTDVGTEAGVEASLTVPAIDVDIGGEKDFPGPGINLLDLWGTGDLNVTSSTTGKDVFPGQIYVASVARSNPGEPPPWFAVLSSALGVNDGHLFPGGFLCRQFFAGAPLIPPFIEAPQDCDLVATGHTVDLTGIAWNCTAAEPIPAAVQVRPRNPFDINARLTRLTLSVVCRSAYAVVRDRVNALFAAGAIDNAGVANALLSKLTTAEAYRDAGDVVDAGIVISDFMNQLRAQSGKHITTVAAAELNDLATLLAHCYLTLVPSCSSVPAAARVALQSLGQ